jgi:hypothetical protein
VGARTIGFVGRLIAARLRPGDLAARFGGDEFVVVLPGTEAAPARAIAEAIRTDIAAARTLDTEPVDIAAVTASVGLASAPDHADDPDSPFAPPTPRCTPSSGGKDAVGGRFSVRGIGDRGTCGARTRPDAWTEAIRQRAEGRRRPPARHPPLPGGRTSGPPRAANVRSAAVNRSPRRKRAVRESPSTSCHGLDGRERARGLGVVDREHAGIRAPAGRSAQHASSQPGTRPRARGTTRRRCGSACR